jgi:hypothetical protein
MHGQTAIQTGTLSLRTRIVECGELTIARENGPLVTDEPDVELSRGLTSRTDVNNLIVIKPIGYEYECG